VRKIVFTVAVAVCGLEVALSAQPLPVFKASVDLVPISAVVRDGRGRLVKTLSATDFEVFDKGNPRRIVDFQVNDAGPLTMAVLVDVSGSMRMGPRMGLVREVVAQLTAGLNEGHDEAALFTFDESLHENQPFTTTPSSLAQALSLADPFGSTSLYDAIAATAQRLETRPSRRRAIVVLTDGIDTSSSLTPAEVSALASSIDVPVYVVATVPKIDHELYRNRTASAAAAPSGDLRDLALWTGGDLLWVNAELDAAGRAQSILSELRHQYVMAIESATDGEWRPLDVRTRNRRLSVRTRSGYFGRDNRITQ
jgi:Ca-activated chloride channel family protein